MDSATSGFVIDVGDEDFETAVLERSKETPVVVDFWAPWCGPCQALGPLLERLAEEHRGAFILAKVNVDESPGLSAALRIQSIPMVLGFRGGQAVSEFVGALPEPAVRAFLKKVLPSEADHLAAAADQLLTDGKIAEAEARFRQALELDGRCDPALLGLAGILGARNHYQDALRLLDRIPPGPVRQAADRLAADIRIRESGGGNEPALRAQVAANPADLEARLLLGQVLAAAAKYDEALNEYLEIVRRNRTFRDGAARKAMLDIFDLLGADNELTGRYRSELAKVLFS
jgi:putative thioredoxin